MDEKAGLERLRNQLGGFNSLGLKTRSIRFPDPSSFYPTIKADVLPL
jgi:hypothetical protein